MRTKRARIEGCDVSDMPLCETSKKIKVDSATQMEQDENKNITDVPMYRKTLMNLMDDAANKRIISDDKREQPTYHNIPIEIKIMWLSYCHPLRSMPVCKEWEYIIKSNVKHMMPISIDSLVIRIQSNDGNVMVDTITKKSVEKAESNSTSPHEFSAKVPIDSIFDSVRFMHPKRMEIMNVPYSIMRKLMVHLPDWWLRRIDHMTIRCCSNDDNGKFPDILAKMPLLKTLLLTQGDRNSNMNDFLKNVKSLEYLMYENLGVKATDDDLKIIERLTQSSENGLHRMVIMNAKFTVPAVIHFIENAKFRPDVVIRFHNVEGDSSKLMKWRNSIDDSVACSSGLPGFTLNYRGTKFLISYTESWDS